MGIIFIWFLLIIVTSYMNNSVKILNRNNIAFKPKGYTASRKSVLEIIEKYSENESLVKKLKKALFYARVSEILLFSFIVVMIILILLTQSI